MAMFALLTARLVFTGQTPSKLEQNKPTMAALDSQFLRFLCASSEVSLNK